MHVSLQLQLLLQLIPSVFVQPAKFSGISGLTPGMHASNVPQPLMHIFCLQCFDAVSWAGTASLTEW